MGISLSILLIAVGAILAWAVNAEVSGIDLQVAGIILVVVGVDRLRRLARLLVELGRLRQSRRGGRRPEHDHRRAGSLVVDGDHRLDPSRLPRRRDREGDHARRRAGRGSSSRRCSASAARCSAASSPPCSGSVTRSTSSSTSARGWPPSSAPSSSCSPGTRSATGERPSGTIARPRSRQRAPRACFPLARCTALPSIAAPPSPSSLRAGRARRVRGARSRVGVRRASAGRRGSSSTSTRVSFLDSTALGSSSAVAS